MQWHRDLAEKLMAAKHGEAGKIIDAYAAMSGKSKDTLYRLAKQNGYTPERKQRADKGLSKSGITEIQLQYVSTLLQTTARQNKGVIMPVEKALQIAQDNGIIDPGQISVSRLQQLLKERNMNKEALDSDRASIRMASEYPNQVHIFDASICIQYYLKKGKGLMLLDERDFREKKPKNMAKIKQRLIRMVLADHFSNTIFIKYYVAAGECQEITYDFLCSAWRGLGEEKFPFRGVPDFLLMDAGSANIAKGIMELLRALEIKTPENMPHNPRRQGSAECAQNIVERWFESTLHLEPAYTIEQLNQWAQDWMIHFNATHIHTRHGMPRTNCWLQIKAEELRELPVQKVLHELYSEPLVTRTVKQDNTIDFQTDAYRLKHIPGIRPKVKVQVRRRPYLLPQIAVIFDDQEYLVDPIGTLAGGFSGDAAIIGKEYKAQPDTPAETVRKANSNLAFGEEQKKDALPFGGTLVVHGHLADKVTAIPIPKRGTPMEVGRDLGEQRIAIGTFLKSLRGRIGAVSMELNRELKAEFGSSIEAARADQVIADIEAGRDWRRHEDQHQAQAL